MGLNLMRSTFNSNLPCGVIYTVQPASGLWKWWMAPLPPISLGVIHIASFQDFRTSFINFSLNVWVQLQPDFGVKSIIQNEYQ
jgi:hypothetical protein